VSSVSWIDALIWYHRSRFPGRMWLPLIVFLCSTAWMVAPPVGPLGLLWMVTLAATLTLQFRLWDDLSDREYDQRVHPHRVLPGTSSLVPFRTLLAVTTLFNLLLLSQSPGGGQRLVAFLVLSAGLLVWYTCRRADAPTLVGMYVVLAKYPVFIYLLSGLRPDTDPLHRMLAMVTVYLCFSIHELLHDPALRVASGATSLLAINLALLTAIPSLGILARGTLESPSVTFLAATTAALISSVLVVSCRLQGVPGVCKLVRYGIFAVGLLAVLSFPPGANL